MQQPPSRQQSKYNDPQMLQRQIMFKQLQELQRKQQLQELGDARSQNYINQLSSLKQASGGQFPTTANGTPILDSSQMFMVGNMRMMQHGGSGVVQGLPNGFVPSQNQDQSVGPVGMSNTQFNTSLYGNPAPNSDKNLNNYTYLQGPSANLLSKANNMSLGMPPLQPLAVSNSFMSQQCNFSPDQISALDGSLLTNQVFQEKNLFEHSQIQGFSRGILPGNFSPQGNTMSTDSYALESDGNRGDTGWHGFTPRKISKLGMSSLDPLEQKILYNTDDSSWESSFSRSSYMGTGGLAVENSSYIDALPSAQSGSWSALMQSAVAETSSSDTGIQEEWSGLSFQNPEPSADNQTLNFTDGEKQENNWVDRNLQKVSSPSQKPENLFQNPNMNCSFPTFQQSGNQFLKHQEGFYSESSHVENQHSPRYTSQLTNWNSQLKQPTGVSQVTQTSLLSSNIWPGQHKEQSKNVVLQSHNLSCANDNNPSDNFSGQDLRAASWLHRSKSYPVGGDIQKQFDQVNQTNIHGYSTESEKMAPGNDVEPMSAFLSSPDLHGQSVTAQSGSMLELLNKDDISDDHAPGVQLNAKVSTSNELPLIKTSAASFATPCDIFPMSQGFGFRLGLTDPRTPQSYSFFPSLPTGNSSAASSSSHNVNDYIKSQCPAPPLPSDMANKFPAYSGATSQEKSHLEITHKNGPELPLSDNLPNQQSATSIVSQHMGFPISMPSSWSDMTTQKHISSTKPYKLSSNLFGSPDSASSSLETSLGAPTDRPNKNSYEHEPSYQVNHRDNNLLGIPPRDIGAFGHSLNQNYSMLRQVHPPMNAETDYGENLPLQNDTVNNQQALSNARELLLAQHKPGIKDEAKSGMNVVSQLSEFSSGVNKGLNFSQEVHGDQSGKASSTAYHQNFQQMEMFGQIETRNYSIGSNEASNITYGSQISLQMAPSWFKHYGTLKNGEMLPIYDPNNAIDEAKRFSGMTLGNFPENNLFVQANSANTSQGSGVWPSAAAAGTLLASKQLSPLSMLPSDVTHQNMAVSKSKKRKIVSFEMVPWHKEVNHEPSSLQNISTTELEWAQASNRRQEEVKVEAEIVEDVLPLVQAKRRLVFTTQLMQKLFRPAPSAVLRADASANCDCVAYSASRLALGDACSLTSQLPSDINESPDKQKTSKRTNACNFSKVVKDLESRLNRLEGNLSRLEILSLADLKVETQELEKFSIINRFAKFHIKVHSSTIDPTSSPSVPMVQKINPQRYVMALPMPRTVPEGIDCLSL